MCDKRKVEKIIG